MIIRPHTRRARPSAGEPPITRGVDVDALRVSISNERTPKRTRVEAISWASRGRANPTSKIEIVVE
jgi:hypothetical protein